MEILNSLENEFNRLRGQEPIIMDAMLEALEQMKAMKRNYEQLPDLYHYDYKDNLDRTVKERQKVYELNVVPDEESSNSD